MLSESDWLQYCYCFIHCMTTGFFVQLETAENSSVIIIPECKRSHSGKYSITAKNKAGQKTANCRVKVMGKKGFKSYCGIRTNSFKQDSTVYIVICIQQMSQGHPKIWKSVTSQGAVADFHGRCQMMTEETGSKAMLLRRGLLTEKLGLKSIPTVEAPHLLSLTSSPDRNISSACGQKTVLVSVLLQKRFRGPLPETQYVSF